MSFFRDKCFICFIISVLIICLSAGIVLAAGEENPLSLQISEMFNLDSEPQIQKAEYWPNEVVLWMESQNNGHITNWGLVQYHQGKPLDSWTYTGLLTDTFSEFHLSFHQFTQDGRLELTVVGTDPLKDGWAYFFIFNLTDEGLSLMFESETNSRGGSYFVKPEEIYSQGMFLDLDLDSIEELFIYREVKGSLPQGPCWVDIYSWKKDRFVKVNEKYPEFYIPFFDEFKKAAEEEEKLPMGNHRIYYEYMAKIYQIWNEEKGVQEALQKSLLPPMEMGKKVKQILDTQGLRIYKVIRVDLDGITPDDSIVWTQGMEGIRQEIWVVSQKNDQVNGPFAFPIRPEFLTSGEEDVEFIIDRPLIQLNRRPDGILPETRYCFNYSGEKITLVGRETIEIEMGGKVLHTVVGQMLTEFEVKDPKTERYLPLILAEKSDQKLKIDGILSEQVWLSNGFTTFKHKNIIHGKEEWKDEEDLSFDLKTGYLGNSLYLAIKVSDDIRLYPQNFNPDLLSKVDHVELWFEDSGQLYHYRIYNFSTSARIVEGEGNQLRKPSHQITAQWMPSTEGYWIEVEIEGIDLSQETYPLTVQVFDTDVIEDSKNDTFSDGVNNTTGTIISTSPFLTPDKSTLGIILLK